MSSVEVSWVLASFLLLQPTKASPIRVACIGDSITQGSGLSNPSNECYPTKLGRLLGTNYLVANFGVSGRTLLKSGDYPYWKEASFTNSHNWRPDVVVIQLGTNDGKPYNWRYGSNFVSDYEDLVLSYSSLTNHPRLVVCTPCPVYGKGAYDIVPGTVAAEIAPRVRDVAGRFGLRLIDLQVRLAGHPELFPDTVHPSSKGTTVLASVIASELLGLEPTAVGGDLCVRREAKRMVLSWPTEQKDLVPQFTQLLRGTNTAWSVSEASIYPVGDTLLQTNTVPGTARFYRLWRP